MVSVAKEQRQKRDLLKRGEEEAAGGMVNRNPVCAFGD